MSLWPGPVEPMLATAVAEPFDSQDHWFEVKWDGIRCLAFVEKDAVRLQSRNLRDITGRYPALTGLARLFRGKSRAIVDGELIGFAAGRPSFQAAVRSGGASVMVAFDLLHLDGEDLAGRPLEERRSALERSFICAEELVCAPPVASAGKGFYAAVVAQGLEGIVAKRLGSAYRPGVRSRDWLKVAHRRTVDCLVCGLTSGAVPVQLGGRAYGFGSFVLGVPRDDREGLVYAGNVGTGWDSRGLQQLVGMLAPAGGPPFERGYGPPGRIARATLWVTPEVVVEVAYREVTPDAILRHPSLLRVRDDRDPGSLCPLPVPGGGPERAPGTSPESVSGPEQGRATRGGKPGGGGPQPKGYD